MKVAPYFCTPPKKKRERRRQSEMENGRKTRTRGTIKRGKGVLKKKKRSAGKREKK